MNVRAALLMAAILGALAAGAPASAAGGGCRRPKGASVVVANAHAAIFTRAPQTVAAVQRSALAA